MNKKELQTIAHAAAKNIKTEDDLKDFFADANQDYDRSGTER